MRVSKRRCLIAVPLLLAFSAGCPSVTSMHTARPIAPGEFELGVAPVLVGSVADGKGTGLPWIQFGMRYGISDTVDFGLLYVPPLQVSTDVNIAIINTGSFALSIDPTIQPIAAGGDNEAIFLVWAYLPVLIDVVGTETFALTLNVKPGVAYASAASDLGGEDELLESGTTYVLGGGIGLKIMLTDRFGIMPELGATYFLDAPNDVVYWTAALGFMFSI